MKILVRGHLLALAFVAASLAGCSRGYLCASDAKANIADTMTIDEITRVLGPHYTDVGFGLHVLRYGFPDSSALLIGGPSMSARPLYVRVAPPEPRAATPKP